LNSLELYDVENDSSERINLARKYPEIVLDYLGKYENWFDDVTQERDARGIQRIFVGNAAQPTVQLSRFDWGGPRNITGNNFGYWDVHSEAGEYRITLHYSKASDKGMAHIKYQEVHVEKPIKEGDTTTVFENVLLPEGAGNLQAFLKTERLPTGVLYVDVERIDE
jgi:arylsulfatase/arylsulfatase A